MKLPIFLKLFFLTFFVFMALMPHQAIYAQTATPAAASPAEDEEQIERIKDIVASRVAELKLVEKKAVLGTVLSATSTQLTLSDLRGDRRIIEIDELTKFNKANDDDFGISDIKTGDYIGVVGLLNKAAQRILARHIRSVSTIPEYFNGVVTELDAKNFQVRAVNETGEKRIIDIVPSTKTFAFAKEDGQIKSGFSKITIGERIFAAGFNDAKNTSQINATRVIHFLDLPASEKMLKYLNATTPTPTETEE